MKSQTSIIYLASIALVLVALCTTQFPATAASHSATMQVNVETQAVSGKIASVEESSFTLSVGSQGQQLQEESGKTMTFQVDKNTTIDGKLQVGASADVTYRTENGNNIAVNVRVM
jgi:hypothetical protein